MTASTPWQLGLVSEILRALARDDLAAVERYVARPPWLLRLFSRGGARILREAKLGWSHEALAPWRSDGAGPRSFKIRSDGSTTLARFAERDAEVLVLVIEHAGDARLRAVRPMARDAFESFGEIV